MANNTHNIYYGSDVLEYLIIHVLFSLLKLKYHNVYYENYYAAKKICQPKKSQKIAKILLLFYQAMCFLNNI